MLKRIFTTMALGVVALGIAASSAFATGNIDVYVNNKEIQMDAKPYIKNSRTYVPLRFVAEALGGEVKWDQNSKTAIVQKDGKEIRMEIGSRKPSINGQTKLIDAAAEIDAQTGGRTMVPLRFVSEALGCSVKWTPKGSDGRVDIFEGEVPPVPTTQPTVDVSTGQRISTEPWAKMILGPRNYITASASDFKVKDFNLDGVVVTDLNVTNNKIIVGQKVDMATGVQVILVDGDGTLRRRTCTRNESGDQYENIERNFEYPVVDSGFDGVRKAPADITKVKTIILSGSGNAVVINNPLFKG